MTDLCNCLSLLIRLWLDFTVRLCHRFPSWFYDHHRCLRSAFYRHYTVNNQFNRCLINRFLAFIIPSFVSFSFVYIFIFRVSTWNEMKSINLWHVVFVALMWLLVLLLLFLAITIFSNNNIQTKRHTKKVVSFTHLYDRKTGDLMGY